MEGGVPGDAPRFPWGRRKEKEGDMVDASGPPDALVAEAATSMRMQADEAAHQFARAARVLEDVAGQARQDALATLDPAGYEPFRAAEDFTRAAACIGRWEHAKAVASRISMHEDTALVVAAAAEMERQIDLLQDDRTSGEGFTSVAFRQARQTGCLDFVRDVREIILRIRQGQGAPTVPDKSTPGTP